MGACHCFQCTLNVVVHFGLRTDMHTLHEACALWAVVQFQDSK